MKSYFAIINTALIIGALQGIVLATLLINRRGNVTANRILSGIVYFISFSILFHVLSHNKAIAFLNNHEIFISIISIINAPLIYFYTKALTVYKFKFKTNDLLHLIPLVCTSVLGLPMLFKIFDPVIQGLIYKIIIIISFVVFLIYILLANSLLLSYARIIKNNYSSLEKINLIWLRIFIFCLALFWVFAGIADLFLNIITWDFVWLASCIIIFLIAYFGFMQPEIFSAPVVEHNKKIIKKYGKSTLTGKKAQEYLEKLDLAMNEQKLFLNEDISLSGLAKKLEISIHHLSQIINEQLGLSFYDYINSRRIEEAKRLLIDHYDQNIASIGFDSGFNSLSAFNTAFKKFIKKTPSEFRREKSG